MASSTHRANIIKLIEKNAYRHSAWEVFSDFLTIYAISISNSMNHAKREEREKYYLDTIRKYDKEEVDNFVKMGAELVMEMESYAKRQRFTDVLGKIFHEMEFHDKWQGQFFTPQDIASMIGKVTCNWEVIEKAIRVYGYASINEPCCGSGATLLGFLNGFYEMGEEWKLKLNHSNQILMVAQDVDARCCMMAYIQLSLYGVPAIVEQRNTLTMELFDTWHTPAYAWGGWNFRRHHAMQVRNAEHEVMEMLEA